MSELDEMLYLPAWGKCAVTETASTLWKRNMVKSACLPTLTQVPSCIVLTASYFSSNLATALQTPMKSSADSLSNRVHRNQK